MIEATGGRIIIDGEVCRVPCFDDDDDDNDDVLTFRTAGYLEDWARRPSIQADGDAAGGTMNDE